MNYQRLLGVEALAKAYGFGAGAKIAILDSGTPSPNLCKWSSECRFDDCDVFGHATAVASILFGGFGITGVCPGATPCFYRVLDDKGHGSAKSVANGILRAIDDDVDIINLSLGFSRTEKCPKALEKACESAYEAGKAIICAAGNDGGPVNWPAALKTTISVGSTGKNDLKTVFSSVGEVDFVAPGTNLDVLCPDGRMKTVSGTSFSAALVSGVSALLLSGFRLETHSAADVEALRADLKGLARDVDAPGWDSKTGYGLISGKKHDSTVCMKIESGFFGRIIAKIQSLVGFGKMKEMNDGRV